MHVNYDRMLTYPATIWARPEFLSPIRTSLCQRGRDVNFMSAASVTLHGAKPFIVYEPRLTGTVESFGKIDPEGDVDLKSICRWSRKQRRAPTRLSLPFRGTATNAATSIKTALSSCEAGIYKVSIRRRPRTS